MATTPSAVKSTVRTGRVPRHSNKKRAVVAVIRGPPFFGVRHEGHDVRLYFFQIEGQELFPIIEGVGRRRARQTGRRCSVEWFQIELVGPPGEGRRRDAKQQQGAGECINVGGDVAGRVCLPVIV